MKLEKLINENQSGDKPILSIHHNFLESSFQVYLHKIIDKLKYVYVNYVSIKTLPGEHDIIYTDYWRNKNDKS